MSFRFVPTQLVIENSKKIAKQFKKIKKYHYGYISTHPRLKEEEKGRKEKLSFRSVPTWRITENSKKIPKKFKKLNNTIMAPFRAKIGWKRLRKGENKNYRFVSFRSYPARNRKCQKKKQKIKKIKKNTIMASFQAKIVWKRPRKRENKNYRFVPFLPDAL